MSYIGATLKEVRDAIRLGRMRFVQRRSRFPGDLEARMVDVRGAGTHRFSTTLETRLVRQWWDAGRGAKIVVGWVHSDGLRGNAYRLVTVVVTRPATTSRKYAEWIRMIDYHKHNHMRKHVFYEGLFRKILADEVEAHDPAANGFSGDGPVEARAPTFYEHQARRLSYYVVWPVGILDNRTSNALNKVQYVEMAHRQAANDERFRMTRARQLSFVTKGRERYDRTLYLAKPIITRYLGKQRKTRDMYANVLGELRAVPRGALHPSFPGGANYLASLKRLKTITTTKKRKKH